MEYFNIKEAIEAQENYCREHELPRFAPSDGFCEHCCTNIYACHINMVRERFGSKGAMEAAELLDRNSAFFAGGEIPQEDKDAFFEAIMTAYVTAKTEAKKKFTPNSRKPSDGE